MRVCMCVRVHCLKMSEGGQGGLVPPPLKQLFVQHITEPGQTEVSRSKKEGP